MTEYSSFENKLNKKTVADMHTHSKNSHDSECEIKYMLLSQIEKGTGIFAVTDHFDTFAYNDYDVFTPIKNAFDSVCELNKEYGEKCLVLSGIEISEGFWYPEVYEKIMNYLPYDVVIGSVHAVRYGEMLMPYSGIDFSKLSQKTVSEYLDAYFDDVLTMLKEEDFDILAHLTCPIRYISGKYNIAVDLSDYREKTEEILRQIIEKNIALEVNTSSYDMLGDFLPDCEIIKKYYTMGGRLITLGSDAHISQNASLIFEKALKLLKETGFKNIYYYVKRKAYKIDI